MPETVAQPPIAESAPPKEKLQYHDEFVGLRSRLLMGGEMLDHNKPIPDSADEIRSRFEKKDVRANTTYRNLAKLSTDERIKYWQKRARQDEKLSEAEKQKSAWLTEVVSIYNDPENSDYKAVFGKFEVDINWKEFNRGEAEKLYQRYFQDSRMTPVTLDGQTIYIPSSVAQYVEDIAGHYINEKTVEGKKQYSVDLDELKKDLPTIQAFSSIFGDQHSYEILAQLIDGETKNLLEEKRNEEINATLQKEKVGNVENPGEIIFGNVRLNTLRPYRLQGRTRK